MIFIPFQRVLIFAVLGLKAQIFTGRVGFIWIIVMFVKILYAAKGWKSIICFSGRFIIHDYIPPV
jgi:hypothetical protein